MTGSVASDACHSFCCPHFLALSRHSALADALLADESFRSRDFMVHTKLYFSQIVLQISAGTLAPITLLGATQVIKLPDLVRKRIYVIAGCLTLVGIFAMRWNVVIGGQLFSKSFLGYTTYKMGLITREGLLMTVMLSLLPLFFLWVLVKLLPPWYETQDALLQRADSQCRMVWIGVHCPFIIKR